AKQRGVRSLSEYTYYLWSDQRDLPIEVRPAWGRFVFLRHPVVRGPALYHVCNEHLGPFDASFLQEVVKYLAGGAHKRPALFVFASAGSLAYEHYLGRKLTLAGYSVLPCPCKLAERTASYFGCYLFKRVVVLLSR